MIEMQQQASISQTRQRVASRALRFAILLTLTLIAAHSARAQTLTVLHKFTGGWDGAGAGSVIRDAEGNLYGVAGSGGSFNFGTVFELDKAGKATVLHNFSGVDGLGPFLPLIRDSAGNLYGTTFDGGTLEGGKCKHGCGTVFSIDKTGKETVLHAFNEGTDGGSPDSLVQDEAGNIYGAAGGGGDTSCPGGCGVLFKLDSAGKLTVVYSFTGGADGAGPYSLLRDRAGNLYGLNTAGRYGSVFKLDTKGKVTLLYSFTDGTDGGYPVSVLRDGAGNFYGVTSEGGDLACSAPYGCGVVFKVDVAAGKETVLYSFPGGADGQYPSSLVRDTGGTLYGTTYGGGGHTGKGCYADGCGTVFKVSTGGVETILHAFAWSDGAWPDGLILGSDDNLFGTTINGGRTGCYYGCGVVFKLSP
jgi:uncharacterized repeat protein (TIGR03803 family)